MSTNQLRRIQIEISKYRLYRESGPVLQEARISVETDRDQYNLTEVIPESDFGCVFDWFMDRARREIVALVKKSEVS